MKTTITKLDVVLLLSRSAVAIVMFAHGAQKLFGWFGGYLSASVIIIMLGAIFTVHLPNGFFMNWHGNLQGEGYEMHILLISLAFINMMYEGGVLSLQDWANKKLRKAHIHDGMFFI